MSNLVVGHVSASSARVWTRGGPDSRQARLRYRAAGTTAWTDLPPRPLADFRGFVEVFELAGLAPSTAYECQLSFQSGKAPLVARAAFTTAPAGPQDFSFLLGSCNWSRGGLIRIGDARRSWEGVRSLVGSLAPAFMIHCGDQVYADVFSGPLPGGMHLKHYRGLYQTAWKVPATAQVLASLPHYMMLDDHEIFDDYYNGKEYVGQPSDAIRDFALAAYREYQHAHSPRTFAPDLYYSFDWAGAQVFALDVRTERHKGEHAIMVSPQQMARFQQWLESHREAVKLVVTSVPFVGQARSGDDKWNGSSFAPQRDELIDFVARRRIGRLVFLTGDMHCSYHATLTVRSPGGDLVLHELMSSPINQVGSGLHGLVTDLTGTTAHGTAYTVRLGADEFYGAHSNVMHVRVGAAGRVEWDVYRTKGVQTPPVPVLAGPPFQV